MTKQEFFKRTNIELTDKDFGQIHDIYMATRLDKDEFCREFKEHGKSQIICHLHECIKGMAKDIKNITLERDMAEETIKMMNEELGEFLATKGYENNDDELKAKAIELLGKKAYIRFLLDEDFNLIREDRKLASELLKQ